jgi:type I restriction enzyme S subunit
MMKTDKRTLPNGWRWAKLEDLGSFDSGGTPSKNEKHYWGGDIPFVTGADITDLYITAQHARAFLTDAGLTSGKTAICKPGTILFVTRTRVGRVGIAADVMGASQDLSPYACGPEIVPEFACRYLQSVSDYLISGARGSTIQGLTREFVHKLEIPVPPLDEQRRIAAILSEQLAIVERARVAAKAQLEAAEALPAAYLRAVFNDSQQWPMKRLGDLLQLRKEVIHPYDKPSGPAMFVGLEHIESGTGIRIGSEPVEMSNLAGRKPRFYKGDIVYGYLRPYLNKVWIAEFDGLCSVDQYVYSVDASQADTAYVAWFMRSPSYLKRAPIDTTPGQLPRIRLEEVAAVEIDLPSLAEQQSIVCDLDSRLASARQAYEALRSQLDAIEKMPAALLRQAFNGEL